MNRQDVITQREAKIAYIQKLDLAMAAVKIGGAVYRSLEGSRKQALQQITDWEEFLASSFDTVEEFNQYMYPQRLAQFILDGITEMTRSGQAWIRQGEPVEDDGRPYENTF